MSERLPSEVGIVQPTPLTTEPPYGNESETALVRPGIFDRLRNRWTTGIALAATALAVAEGPNFDAQPAYADSAKIAIVGMPFEGRWAWPVVIDPPYNDENSSHPSDHHIPAGGHWGTDLYAAAGTDVKLHATGVNGSVSFSWGSASGSCGESRRINVSVDNTPVGWLYFTHLSNAAATTGAPTNGMTIGKVANLGCNPGGSAGKHIHVESRNTTNHSCYVDKGKAGSLVAEAADFGVLGSTNNGIKQACGSGGSTLPPQPTTQYDDYGIYRFDPNDSTGYWYAKSSTNGQPTPIWGAPHGSPGDVPVVGDFDGDGYDDFGVYRGGTWYVKSSGTGQPTPIWGAVHGGLPGDIPVAGDVNGDHIADFGIYRLDPNSSTGYWYFKSGANGQNTPIWGAAHGSPGDVPVVGDMNNDDIDDFGIFRMNPNDSTGYWYFKSSANGQPTPIWGAAHGSPGDVPVVGDFSGDDIDDFGIYRGGTWYMKSGSNGQPITSAWGATHGGWAGDVPVPGNFGL